MFVPINRVFELSRWTLTSVSASHIRIASILILGIGEKERKRKKIRERKSEKKKMIKKENRGGMWRELLSCKRGRGGKIIESSEKQSRPDRKAIRRKDGDVEE